MLLIRQPLNVATPLRVAFVLPPLHVKVPPPGLAPRVSVTVAVGALVTVAPPAFCRATTGWTAKAPFGVPRAGWVVNPSFVAVPGPLVVAEVELSTLPPPLHVAPRREPLPAMVMLQPEEGARPFCRWTVD